MGMSCDLQLANEQHLWRYLVSAEAAVLVDGSLELLVISTWKSRAENVTTQRKAGLSAGERRHLNDITEAPGCSHA